MSAVPESPGLAETARRMRGRLPPAVRDLAMRLGADPRRMRAALRLEQRGRMRSIDSARWMAFRAKQTISTVRCAFDWRARAGPAGLITARDALTEDGGRFDVRALGLIPIVHAEPTLALQRGQLLRYLAELAWAPDAILNNEQLRWRPDGRDGLAVSAGSGEAAAEVALSLDSQGRIAGSFAPDRPRSAKATFLPTPWRGRFSDYRLHDERWLPFAAEVCWEIDGEEVVYWQGRLERWEAFAEDR